MNQWRPSDELSRVGAGPSRRQRVHDCLSKQGLQEEWADSASQRDSRKGRALDEGDRMDDTSHKEKKSSRI